MTTPMPTGAKERTLVGLCSVNGCETTPTILIMDYWLCEKHGKAFKAQSTKTVKSR